MKMNWMMKKTMMTILSLFVQFVTMVASFCGMFPCWILILEFDFFGFALQNKSSTFYLFC